MTSCPAGACQFDGSFDIPIDPINFFHGTLAFGGLTVAVATTPIPATLPLLVSALGVLGFAGWRRRQADMPLADCSK